jgi:undecaprenyl diphosphate synthase
MANHSTTFMAGGPTSIGIIMDGNRRWAKAAGVSSLEGHKAGLAKAKEIAQVAFNAGVTTLYYYAFSTENWKRAPEEVSYLLSLFESAITSEFDEFGKENIQVRFIGDLSRMPSKLASMARDLEEKTASNTRGTLVIALSYGGRSEIVHAVNKLIQEGREVVSEEELGRALWTGNLPNPELIIRTSGEERLSNFLTWQSVYSELIFTETLWPAYTKEEFEGHLAEYRERKRNFGA